MMKEYTVEINRTPLTMLLDEKDAERLGAVPVAESAPVVVAEPEPEAEPEAKPEPAKPARGGKK
ncbi:hypothetical protein KRX56_06090 [Dermabacteraceae bacterium TAE3-ERU27]|nr:hypothetical protein [Dermabacteraceae bacterium TAE3-ERU27]